MALPDSEFIDGFDHYTGAGNVTLSVNTLLLQEWNSITNSGGTAPTTFIVDALSGTGYALRFNFANGTFNDHTAYIAKTLPGNYARQIGGVTISPITNASNHGVGVTFLDGVTAQLSIVVNHTTGTISVRRGSPVGTLIATSTESMSIGSVHTIEWDITFHNTTGIIKVYLDGVICTNLNLTGQDTCSNANNYINGFAFSAANNNSTKVVEYDHLYLFNYTASGGSETPLLDTPIIETSFPDGDFSVNFTPGPSTLGGLTRTTTATNAPGANQLALRPFTPLTNCTLDAVCTVSGATSATAKFKAVLYADSGGSPGALTATGTEVVGCTSGSALSMPFASGQSLIAGTQYWLGYITDTSVVIQQSDTGTTGQRKANTYTSGAPNPAGAMTTGQPSWRIWGTLSGMPENFTQVDIDSPSTLEYNYASAVGDKDLYNFDGLVNVPNTVHLVAMRANVSKSDGGSRTLDLIAKSGATESTGTDPAIAAPVSMGYVSSYFWTDPDTGVAWTGAGASAAQGGVEIDS